MVKGSKKAKAKNGRKESINQFSVIADVSRFFFRNKNLTSLLIIALFIFGTVVYGSLIRREGFPSVAIPQSVLTGQTIAEAEQVNTDFVLPMQAAISSIDGVADVATTANDNFFSIVIEYDDSETKAAKEAAILQELDGLGLPCGGERCYEFLEIDAAKFLAKYDMVVSIYSQDGPATAAIDEELLADLTDTAESFMSSLSSLETISQAEVITQETNVQTPEEVVTIRDSYAIFGQQESGSSGQLAFYDSVNIGVIGLSGDELDIFQLRNDVDTLLADFNSTDGTQHRAAVTIDLTDQVDAQIRGLQTNVLQAVLAVFILVAIVISLGAALITGLFIVLVILMTVIVLYLTGNSINTISLFAMVLSLGLFVDDSIVISESVQREDSNNKDSKTKLEELVGRAVERVATASLMGTLTTMLVFGVLFAIGGIIGDFIVVIPLTVLIALASSYILSIIAIPHLSRYTILRSNPFDEMPLFKSIHAFFRGDWMRDAFNSIMRTAGTAKMYAVVAILIAFGSLMAAGGVAGTIGENIFPESEDNDQLFVALNFDREPTVEKSKNIAQSINQIVSDEIGEFVVKGNFSGEQQESSFAVAAASYTLVSYNDRDETANDLIETIEPSIARLAEVNGAKYTMVQGGPGPGVQPYPFNVQVNLKNAEISQVEQFLQAIASDLVGTSITTVSGEVVELTDARIGGINAPSTKNGLRQLNLGIALESKELSSTLVQLQDKIKDEYTPRLAEFGLSEENLEFDQGQEDDNAESFSTMPIAAMGALIVMFVILSIQFRSVVKSGLILTAVPFSFLGVMVGQKIFDIPFSFFTMMGIIGLIGIAVNNTIMLTDRMRREQRLNPSVREALAAAVGARFRPLVATTLTTLAALVPLILFDPFWKALAVVLAGGLISSTLLVLISFPGFYLVAEALHRRVERPIIRALFKRD